MKVMVVDASILIYAAFATVGHFNNSQGEPTGLRYGFVRAIRSYKEKTGARRVLICFDTAAPVLKAAEVAEYKANRTFTEEKDKMYKQVPALRELLKLTAYDQIHEDGYEADDCIARVVDQVTTQGHEAIILTNDNDMCQLVRAQTESTPAVWIQSTNKTKTVKNHKWVVENYGVEPEKLVAWRAATGDVSDNLGPACVDKEVQNEIKEILQKTPGEVKQSQHLYDAALHSTKWHKTLQWLDDPEFRARYDQNIKIMSLHRPNKLTVEKGKKDPEGLLAEFRRLEFKSLMPKLMDYCS